LILLPAFSCFFETCRRSEIAGHHRRMLASTPRRRYNPRMDLVSSDTVSVDAVVIATSDHAQAAVTMAALDERKHVCCEEPPAYSVREGRLLT